MSDPGLSSVGRPVASDPGSGEPGASNAPVEAGSKKRPTRVSAAWVAIAIGLVLLILLLVFMLQNLQRTRISYLGLNGSIPVGVALFAASLAGGVVVGVVGASRVVQLRRAARRL